MIIGGVASLGVTIGLAFSGALNSYESSNSPEKFLKQSPGLEITVQGPRSITSHVSVRANVRTESCLSFGKSAERLGDVACLGSAQVAGK